MPNPKAWAASKARHALYRNVRDFLCRAGFDEVETPVLVPAPGMEPEIRAFEVAFLPELGGGELRGLFLHTSPEYAMKRLLADGAGPIFQISKVFRNGEVSEAHNPEFTLLEFYRPHASYVEIMDDLEALLAECDRASGAGSAFARRPYERVTVQDAVWRETGVDLARCRTGEELAKAALRAGVFLGESRDFEEVFFRLFLERVEPKLGRERPTFVMDYPAPLAALSRLKPSNAAVAERFELYAGGLELANGFSELTDPGEQRRRLEAEQQVRRRAGKPVYPIDERFLEALGRMPPSGGVAVGLDRALMVLTGAQRIEEVLLFPLAREIPLARETRASGK